MTAPGGTEADRAARERLAREARVTATTLLDWVGTRVDGAATTGTTRPAGTEGTRPRQSPGPCGWCPVCALVAAVRGEQPELTAHLAEQASGLLIVLRLLIQSHAHDHPAHEQPAHEQPAPPRPEPTGPETAAHPSPAPGPSAAGAGEPEVAADVLSNPDVPWDAPHAVFDPDPVSATPAPDGSSRTAPDRPTGKRGPRPSPRPRPVDVPATATATTAVSSDRATVAGTLIPDAPIPAAPIPHVPAPVTSIPAPVTPAPAATAPAAPARSDRGVQRIPVRRRPRPC